MVVNSSSRAIFLDRDGVINEAIVKDRKPFPPGSKSEVKVLSGVMEALDIFRKKNYLCVVISNQPDVSRGTISKNVVNEINQTLREQLGLQYFYVCCHDDADQCECRKPKPGLLRMASEELGIDLRKSYMVGDRWRDIEAGQKAKCHCIFLDYNYDERRPDPPYQTFSCLMNFALSLE